MADQTKITWHAPEYRHYEKSIGWYVTFGAIALLIIGFFIIEKDYFAAVTTGILAGLVVFFAQQYPQMVEVSLTNKGVNFGNLHYPYKQLKYFWVVHTKHHKTLNFVSTTYINNTIIVELEDQDPDEIRDFLIQHLAEHHETEATTTQKIMHRVKF